MRRLPVAISIFTILLVLITSSFALAQRGGPPAGTGGGGGLATVQQDIADLQAQDSML